MPRVFISVLVSIRDPMSAFNTTLQGKLDASTDERVSENRLNRETIEGS